MRNDIAPTPLGTRKVYAAAPAANTSSSSSSTASFRKAGLSSDSYWTLALTSRLPIIFAVHAPFLVSLDSGRHLARSYLLASKSLLLLYPRLFEMRQSSGR